jgi:hypothetical protein
MTRKHFIVLAKSLKECKPSKYDEDGGWSREYHTWRTCCIAIANSCRVFNPAFDSARFLEACEYNDQY